MWTVATSLLPSMSRARTSSLKNGLRPAASWRVSPRSLRADTLVAQALAARRPNDAVQARTDSPVAMNAVEVHRQGVDVGRLADRDREAAEPAQTPQADGGAARADAHGGRAAVARAAALARHQVHESSAALEPEPAGRIEPELVGRDRGRRRADLARRRDPQEPATQRSEPRATVGRDRDILGERDAVRHLEKRDGPGCVDVRDAALHLAADPDAARSIRREPAGLELDVDRARARRVDPDHAGALLIGQPHRAVGRRGHVHELGFDVASLAQRSRHPGARPVRPDVPEAVEVGRRRPQRAVEADGQRALQRVAAVVLADRVERVAGVRAQEAAGTGAEPCVAVRPERGAEAELVGGGRPEAPVGLGTTDRVGARPLDEDPGAAVRPDDEVAERRAELHLGHDPGLRGRRARQRERRDARECCDPFHDRDRKPAAGRLGEMSQRVTRTTSCSSRRRFPSRSLTSM